MSILEYMNPAYEITDNLGLHLGTIVPQDDNCRVYFHNEPGMLFVSYEQQDDQGVVIEKIIKTMLNAANAKKRKKVTAQLFRKWPNASYSGVTWASWNGAEYSSDLEFGGDDL